jgi:hypothetical protein
MRTIAIPTQASPLSWPAGVPRTKLPAPSKKFARDITVASQLDEVERQLKLLGAANGVISSNLPLRKDGRPRGDGLLRFDDQGVAVYWSLTEHRGGRWVQVAHCMPCDRWDRIEHNLRAISLSIEAMRGLERWGAVSTEQAFAGFAALPPGDPDAAPPAPADRPWRELLEVPADGWVTQAPPSVVLTFAKQQHRKLIQQHHPDRGGDPVTAAAINRALELAEAELGGAGG